MGDVLSGISPVGNQGRLLVVHLVLWHSFEWSLLILERHLGC